MAMKPAVDGDVVVALRKFKGMSQVQMSCALGVDRQYLRDIEGKAKPVKKPLMDKIQRCFGLAEADLLEIYAQVCREQAAAGLVPAPRPASAGDEGAGEAQGPARRSYFQRAST